MKTPCPCVFLWLAREGNSATHDEAHRGLCAEVKLPARRSMTISGDEDELVSVDEIIDGMPLADRCAEAAIAAAQKKGLDQATFIAAVYFHDISEANTTPRNSTKPKK